MVVSGVSRTTSSWKVGAISNGSDDEVEPQSKLNAVN